MNLLEPLSAL